MTQDTKNIKIESNIRENKNTKINKPLDGSLAKVWIEFKIPDLTKNVPLMLKVKVIIESMKVHD